MGGNWAYGGLWYFLRDDGNVLNLSCGVDSCTGVCMYPNSSDCTLTMNVAVYKL